MCEAEDEPVDEERQPIVWSMVNRWGRGGRKGQGQTHDRALVVRLDGRCAWSWVGSERPGRWE